MSKKLNIFLSASLKSGVALLPLAIAFSQMPANAQTKTQAQLEAEAAAAKAAAETGSDADDAAAAAALFGGLTGTSKVTENTKDIVVTGTQIRGVAPTGTNLTVLTKDDIEATGQVSITQMLTTIPGFSNFNGLPNNIGAASQGTLGSGTRPNLRGTPDGDLAAAGLGDPGSATLILVDGNRQSGGGIRQVATDPDSISPALLERVEVNTDGASSSYGSDAIGGVVNFVTKRRYNGVEISGRLGYADDYWQYDATALAGKDWGSGSAYISANYSYNTPLYNRDRDWRSIVALDTGLQTGLNCDNPNISIASTAASGTGAAFVPAIPAHYYRVNADGSIARQGDVITNGVRTTNGTGVPVGGLATSNPAEGQPTDASRPNLCTLNDRQTMFNKNERYGANLNFFQKLTDDIDFLARANYAYVDNFGINAPVAISYPVSANNPWRQELFNGANGTGTSAAAYPTAQPGFPTPQNDVIRGTTPVAQTVVSNLSVIYGDKDVVAHNWTYKFGGNAEVTWRIDGNWLLKVTGLYDRTTTKVNYGVASFGGSSFLNQYQDGTAGGLCTTAIAAFTAAGGNAAANNPASPQNAAALAQRAAARLVCLNPYNPETSNPTILSKAHNFDSKNLAHDAIIDLKFNVDGALFTIPGGKVRIAVGGEYETDDFERWQYSVGTPVPFSAVHDPRTPQPADPTLYPTGWDPGLHSAGSRYIASGYGEINVPLVSRANELSWIKELRVAVSARYDKYKIFGSSFNPKIGISYKPTNWLAIRGNWNTSFRAPNILLSAAAEGNTITINPAVGGAVSTANVIPALASNQVIWLYGSGARLNLKPQTGKQWSIGIDLTPFRGFRASVSYGYIDYHDSLISPNPLTQFPLRGSSNALAIFGAGSGLPGQGCNESDTVVVLDQRIEPCTTAQIAAGRNPMTVLTDAQIAAAKAQFLAGAVNAADVLSDGRPVFMLVDGRYTNAGNAKIGNLDYKASYNSRTPWGTIFFNVAGTIKLINKDQANDTAPFNQNLNASRHAMTAQAGFTYGPLRSSLALQHSDGYRVNRSATAPQDRVADFNLVNLFATWDFKGDNVIERGLQLSLTINNVLNVAPPVRFTNNTVGTANGSTLGRLVQVGFNKKF